MFCNACSRAALTAINQHHYSTALHVVLSAVWWLLISTVWFLQAYLERFKELILTASGLDMQPGRAAQPLHLPADRRQLLLTAA